MRTHILAIALVSLLPAAEPERLPNGVALEAKPDNPKAIKVVLIAGSNFFKKGEHEYVAGCLALMDLLRQTPNVEPVLALDWPKNPETLAGAKAIVVNCDGGDKHPFLKGDRMEQVRKLADSGVGLVLFHQTADIPKDFGDRLRAWTGGAWEKGHGARAHWIAEFTTFPDHPVMRGVEPFKIDDGWLTKIRFVSEKKGVTPLLRTVSPKTPMAANNADDAVVAWAFDRPSGGRSFVFTGTHLHASLAETGYRRFLTNGILWTAGVEIPAKGAPVEMKPETLEKYLEGRPVGKK
jgi:type 1 glutamine amidotransferase